MKSIKFIVKVNRGGTRAPEYVQRVDPTPIHMTTNRKLALLMGKFTAEDAAKSLQTSQRLAELVSVQVPASRAITSGTASLAAAVETSRPEF